MSCDEEYKKLFKLQDYATYSKDEIEDIKKLIKVVGEDLSNNSNIPAGITYFGQMIAHEIVPSTNNHEDRLESQNTVKPIMNLDSIYDENQYKDNNIFNQYGEFQFNNVTCNNGKIIKDADQARDACGISHIPDQRNDENIIISQLHLLWQKYHNIAIEDNFKSLIKSKKITVSKAIEQTRIIVAITFQKVVADDFLANILQKEIYQYYCEEEQTYLYDTSSDLQCVPLEFSHAAFRFGHSMVREFYSIQKSGNLKFNELFLRRNQKHLDCNQIILWKRFFYTNQAPYVVTQAAFKIDTQITTGMTSIPMLDDENIVGINLKANIDAKISTGNEIYEDLYKTYDDFKTLFDQYHEIYTELHTKSKMPLWYYTLKEAEMFKDINYSPSDDVSTNGLGLVASIIIAEVIMNSIRSYKRSISEENLHFATNYIKSNTVSADESKTEKSFTLGMKDIINFINKKGKL